MLGSKEKTEKREKNHTNFSWLWQVYEINMFMHFSNAAGASTVEADVSFPCCDPIWTKQNNVASNEKDQPTDADLVWTVHENVQQKEIEREKAQIKT